MTDVWQEQPAKSACVLRGALSFLKMGKSVGKSMGNQWKPSLIVDVPMILGKTSSNFLRNWLQFWRDLHGYWVDGIHRCTWFILHYRVLTIYNWFSASNGYVYLHIYIHIYINIYIHTCMYICACIYVHVYIYISVYFLYIYVFIYILDPRQRIFDTLPIFAFFYR